MPSDTKKREDKLVSAATLELPTSLVELMVEARFLEYELERVGHAAETNLIPAMEEWLKRRIGDYRKVKI